MKAILRITLALMMVLFLMIGSSQSVQAAEFDEDGRIEADEIIDDDVFLSGDQIVVDGTVNGLLLATGDTITINGTINGDLFVFGNKVEVSPSATIEGNVFFGSRTATLQGQVMGSVFGGSASAILGEGATVSRNLFYGGYSFQSAADSQVERDLYVGGYQAILDGEIGRDAGFGGGALEVSGSVGRDLKANVDGGRASFFNPNMSGQEDLPAAIEPGLRVAESAVIGNQIIYTSRAPEVEAIQVEPEGGIVVQTPIPNESDGRVQPVQTPSITVRYPVLGWLWDVVRDTITLLAFGALALWLLPRLLHRTVDQARTRTGASAGYGLLTIFGGYFSILVAIVLILLVGIGLSILSLGGLSMPVFGVGFSTLALFVVIFTLLVSTISKVIVSFLIGYLLLDQVAPNASNRQILALIAGVLIYVLVSSIPYVGWLIGIAATLVGVGAMWLAYRAWRNPAPVLLPSQESA